MLTIPGSFALRALPQILCQGELLRCGVLAHLPKALMYQGGNESCSAPHASHFVPKNEFLEAPLSIHSAIPDSFRHVGHRNSLSTRQVRDSACDSQNSMLRPR